MELITLEILRIAKDLVVNEYINMRAQAHNRWLLDSTVLWNTRRIKLPYPDIPPYPNENEILNRAKKLMDFINNPNVPSPIIESLTFIESSANNETVFDSENSKNNEQIKSYTIEELIKKIEEKEELIPERDGKEETSSNIETQEELIPERDGKEETYTSIEFSESNIQNQNNIIEENQEKPEKVLIESNDETFEKEDDNNKENISTSEDSSNQLPDQDPIKDTAEILPNDDKKQEDTNIKTLPNSMSELEEEYQLKINETKKELEEYIKNKDKLAKDEHTMTNGKILSALLKKIEELRKRMSDD